MQAARLVGPLVHDERRLVVAGGRRHAVAGDHARSGSGCPGGPRCRRRGPPGRRARRRARADGGHAGPRSLSPTSRAASAVELARPHARRRAAPAQERRGTGPVATGIDSTALTSASAVPGRAMQALLDVEHDLALDRAGRGEGQRVQGDVDRALDGVLDGARTRGRPRRPRWPRSTSGIVGQRHQLGRGQVGLGQQRLLGERAERAEEADAQAARVRSVGSRLPG